MEDALPFDTRKMTAKEALLEVDELSWAGSAEEGATLFRALHTQETKHPKKPRKTVLDALEERIGEFEVAAEASDSDTPEDTSDGDEMVSEGAPESGPSAEEEPSEEGVVEAEEEVPEESSDAGGEEAESAEGDENEGEEEGEAPEPGATVLVLDKAGVLREAVVIRAIEPDKIPLMVRLSPLSDDEVRVVHDPDGLAPLSWRHALEEPTGE